MTQASSRGLWVRRRIIVVNGAVREESKNPGSRDKGFKTDLTGYHAVRDLPSITHHLIFAATSKTCIFCRHTIPVGLINSALEDFQENRPNLLFPSLRPISSTRAILHGMPKRTIIARIEVGLSEAWYMLSFCPELALCALYIANPDSMIGSYRVYRPYFRVE